MRSDETGLALVGTEHRPVDLKQYSVAHLYPGDPESPAALGLHHASGVMKASHFVGACWLDSDTWRTSLVIRPGKLGSNYELTHMFLAVLDDVEADEYLRPAPKAFFGWNLDEPLLSLNQAEDLDLFQLAAFISSVHRLCQRHLRQRFVERSSNLIGKVKGRVRQAQQVRMNLYRGRTDRTWCTFQTIDEDHTANQILKEALRVSIRALCRIGSTPEATQLMTWSRFASVAFNSVTPREIRDADFKSIRLSGSMSEYRRPIALARMVLRRYSGDIRDCESDRTSSVPFWINMYVLFELYARTRLRAALHGSGWSLMAYQKREPIFCDRRFGSRELEPDFWLVHQETGATVVLDAKYKRWQLMGSAQRSDVHQILAYGKILRAQGLGVVFPQYAPDLAVVQRQLSSGEPYAELPLLGDVAFKAGLHEFLHRVIASSHSQREPYGV